MATHCETCGAALLNRTNRYCPSCAKVVLQQLRKSGYLQETYVPPYFSDERGRKALHSPRTLGGAPF